MIQLILASLLVSSSPGSPPDPDLVVLYTGNIAGYLKPRPAHWINPNYPPILGGAASAATVIEEVRSQLGKDKVLLVDTGPLSDVNLLLEGPGYLPTLFFMNQIGYDVGVPGTRDFLMGIRALRDMSDLADFPIVAANVSAPWNPEERFPFLPPFVVLRKGGLKIGVVGIVSQEMPFLLPSFAKRQFSFLPEIPVVQTFVDSLRRMGVDLVFVASHAGIERDTIISHEVKGIDVLISGFDGRGLWEPYEDPFTHTVVVRGYGGLSEVGRLDLWVAERFAILKKYEGRLISLLVDEAPPDPKWLKFKASGLKE